MSIPDCFIYSIVASICLNGEQNVIWKDDGPDAKDKLRTAAIYT